MIDAIDQFRMEIVCGHRLRALHDQRILEFHLSSLHLEDTCLEELNQQLSEATGYRQAGLLQSAACVHAALGMCARQLALEPKR